MIKQFNYTISVQVQNRLNGHTSTLSKQFLGDIDINESTYFGQFLIADEEPIAYVQDRIEDYCTSQGVTLNDIDIIKFGVTSGDPDVVVFFEKANSTELFVEAPVYAYIENPAAYVSTPPNFTGEAISMNEIKWTWTEVLGCAYKIRNVEGKEIANIGAGIFEYIESDLKPGVNYTRAISAYNENDISAWSSYITVTTIPEDVDPGLRPWSQIPKREFDLNPISMDPDKSGFFKSGIGHGDDLKVSISNKAEEQFDCTAKLIGYETEFDTIYPEKMFQYRQKLTSIIKRVAGFGRFVGEITAHKRNKYNCRVDISVDDVIDIQRNADINVRAEAVGPIAIKRDFKYKVDSEADNIPINVKRDFNLTIGTSYDTSYNFNYRTRGVATYNRVVNMEDYITINAPFRCISKSEPRWYTLVGTLTVDVCYFNGSQLIKQESNVQCAVRTQKFHVPDTTLVGFHNITQDEIKENSSYNSVLTLDSVRGLANYLLLDKFNTKNYPTQATSVTWTISSGYENVTFEAQGASYSIKSELICGKLVGASHAQYPYPTTVPGYIEVHATNNGNPPVLVDCNKDITVTLHGSQLYNFETSYKMDIGYNDTVPYYNRNSSPEIGPGYWFDFSQGAYFRQEVVKRKSNEYGDTWYDSMDLYELRDHYDWRGVFSPIPNTISMYCPINKQTYVQNCRDGSLRTSGSRLETRIAVNTVRVLDDNSIVIINPADDPKNSGVWIAYDQAGDHWRIWRQNADGSSGTRTVNLATAWINYTNLKSYNLWREIDSTAAIEQLKIVASGNAELANKTYNASGPTNSGVDYNIMSVVVESDNIDVSVTVASTGRINAKNIKPDHYESDTILPGSIKSITNSSGITIDIAEIKKIKPKCGTIAYTGVDYDKFVYTLKGMSNSYVKAKWTNSDATTINGPDSISITTDALNGKYKYSVTRSGTIITPLYDAQSTLDMHEEFSTYTLICDKQQLGGTVDEADRVYTGNPSLITGTISKISGDVIISWNGVNTPTVSEKGDAHIITLQTTATYSVLKMIPKTISSESGEDVILVTSAELGLIKPLYQGVEWCFDMNLVTYKIIKDQPGVVLKFQNGSKESLGPGDIYADVTTNIVTFSKSVELSGDIYDYECPKTIFNVKDIVPEAPAPYGKYIKPIEYSKYVISNRAIDSTCIIDMNNGNILADIINPQGKIVVKSIDMWVTTYPTLIQLDANIYQDYKFGIRKLGHHPNTVAKWQEEPNIIKLDGDIVYSSSRLLNIWANTEEIELDDVTYSNRQVGKVNGKIPYQLNNGGKENLVVPISVAVMYDNINSVYSLEIEGQDVNYVIDKGGINDGLDDKHTTLQNAKFVIFSDYSRQIAPDKFITGTKVVSEGLIVKTGEYTDFSVTLPNPAVDIPTAHRTDIRLESGNPNVVFDIMSQEVTETGDIALSIRATVAIESQTPWYPELNPGYYYLSTKEHYMFGESDIESINNGNGTYTCKPLPKPGSPIVVTDENNNPFVEIFGSIDITETVPVINNKFLEMTYAGIDMESIYLNDVQANLAYISVVNNIIVLSTNTNDATIKVRYRLNNSFCVEELADGIKVSVHGGNNHKISYETGDKHTAYSVDLNPLRNQNPIGFIYIKD